MPWTGWLINRNVLFTVLESRKSKIEAPEWLCLVRTLFPLPSWKLHPHMVEGARELSSLFHKAVILFTGFHPYGLRTSQTSHLPIPLYQMILWNHCMTSKLPILGLLFCEGRNLGVFKQLLLWLFVKCSQIQSILIQMLTWGALKNIPRPRLPPRSFRSATLGMEFKHR